MAATSLLPLVAAVSAGLATLAAAGVVAVLLSRRESSLERRLAGYQAIPMARGGDGEHDSKMVRQAVDLAGRLADRAGLLERVQHLLEQADLPLRPAEVLLAWPLLAIVVGLVATVAAGPILGGLTLVGALLIPLFLLRRRRRSRLSAFVDQLPDTLGLLASSMRAGFSLMQGIEAVASETTDPMRRELQRVFTEARLGRPIEESLGEVAERMESADLQWAVMAIRIQREVGGNLSELLDTVAETMVSRDRLRREVKTLTAEGRMSGMVLAIFPPAFGVLLFLLQRDYMGLLLQNTMGIAALVAAGFMILVGWFWLRKIVNIEV